MGTGVSGTAEKTSGNLNAPNSSQFQNSLDKAKKKDDAGNTNGSRGSKSQEKSTIQANPQKVESPELQEKHSPEDKKNAASSDKAAATAVKKELEQKTIKTLAEAQSRIMRNLKEANEGSPNRSKAETALAKKDPVTYALLKELNVNVDPEQKGLSSGERRLAGKSPLTYGLLRHQGIRIGTDEKGTPVASQKGKPVQLTTKQKELYASGNMEAFANSVLADIKPDKQVHLLAAATAAIRVDHTREKVSQLMKGGQDAKALETLRNNMDGAFSETERQMVWKIAGEPHFTESYFKDKIEAANTGASAKIRAKNTGDFLLDLSKTAPPEVASVAIDAVKSSFSGDWLEGTKNARGRSYGSSDGSRIYQGLGALIDKSPDRAEDVAAWMTDKNSTGSALLNKLESNDFDAIEDAASEGNGMALGAALDKKLKAAADANPEEKGLLWNSDSAETNRYEEFSEKFDEAKKEAGRVLYQRYAKKQHDEFSKDAVANTQEFLKPMQGQPGIGTDVKIQSDAELRNLIGKSMGMVPDAQGPGVQDQYATGTEKRKQIDLIAGWIKREGGEGASVKAMPFVYASEKAGVSTGALFEVTSKDGEKTVIDGSMADDIIASNGGKPVSADDDVDLPWKYDSVEEFFDDNLLDPEGKVYMAKGGQLTDQDGDGQIDVQSRAAADTTTWEHVSPWIDTAAGVVGVVGGAVLAIPTMGASLGVSAGAATLLVGGSMAYGLLRSTQELHDMSSHGQEFMTLSNQRARGAWLGIVATGLGAGSIGSTIRAGSQMTRATATLANASGSAAQLAKGAQLTKSAQTWYRAAAGTGYTGAALGVEMMGEQGYGLVKHWDAMTPSERALNFVNFAIGFADVGVGVHAYRQQKAGAAQERHNQRNVIMDDIHNDVAVEIITKGDKLPEVYGTVKEGEDNTLIYTPADGSNERVIKLETPDDAPTTAKTEEAPDDLKPAEGETFDMFDQYEEPVQAEMWGTKDDVPEGAADEVKATDPEDTAPDEAIQETAEGAEDKVEEAPEEPEAAHEFEDYEFVPEPDPDKKLSINRRIDDGVGNALMAIRRGIQTPFEERYQMLREAVVNNYNKAKEGLPEGQELQGSFDPTKLPKYREFRADDNAVLLARIPEGLSHVANDIHVHSMGYDRRSGQYFLSLLSKAGPNSRLLMGSIPQFCGGDGHYSSSTPHKGTLRKAQTLDDRVVNDFYNLISLGKNPATDKRGNVLGAGIHLAAKADLSLTGFDFSAKGTQDVVAYARHHMLENPGLFPFSGELTGKKENVSIQMGPFAWDMTSPKFQSYLKHSAETGMGVLLHYDWGLPSIKETGGKSGTDPQAGTKRIDAAKTAYEHFDEIVSVLGKEEYSDGNFIMAHTGLGRYVRPDSERITAPVTVRDLKGNIIETKEVTAAKHIHKLYEFFDKVPNARADISWSDVLQAYSDSPQLRKDFVDFVIDNQDRLIFGSDTVMPDSRAHYNQALNVGISMMADISKRDRGALWKLIRGNYDAVVDDSRARVVDWTRKELEQQGRHDDIVKMDKMQETLNFYRRNMAERAKTSFDDWADTVDEIGKSTRGLHFDRFGTYNYLYESLPPAKKQEWFDKYYGESHHAHSHGHDHHGHTHDGVGTSGGEVQGDKKTRKKILRDGVLIGTASTVTAGAMSTMGVPTEAGNMTAFAARNLSSLGQNYYQERYRQVWKNVFGREYESMDYRIKPKDMNMFMDAVFESQKALNISDEDMLRGYAAAGQFWANYNMIKNIEVTPETEARGWTREQQYHAASAEINKFQIALDRELGLGVAPLDMWDVRGAPGKVANYFALGTLIVNDAATATWFAQNGLDFSTMTSSADTAMHGLFGLGNLAATWYHGWMASGGHRNASPVNFDKMKKLRTAYTTLFTGAAAAWTVTDVMNFANSAGLMDGGTGVIKVALDAGLTYGLAKLNVNDFKGLSGGAMGEPHDVYKAKRLVFGALFLRTALEVGLISYNASQEEPEKTTDKAAADK